MENSLKIKHKPSPSLVKAIVIYLMCDYSQKLKLTTTVSCCLHYLVTSHGMSTFLCLHALSFICNSSIKAYGVYYFTVLNVGLALGEKALFNGFWGRKTKNGTFRVYLHFSPVGLGHWLATHHTLDPNQDESSSCPPKRESSWKIL